MDKDNSGRLSLDAFMQLMANKMAEKDTKEEKELHERELAEYKMKIHTYDSEVKQFLSNFNFL